MVNIREWFREIRQHKSLIVVSVLFLAISLYINYIAGNYVDTVGTAATSDIILDHIPPINFAFFYIYGYTIVIAILLFHPLFYNVKEFHMVVSQFSLLILIRSFFMSLTHLKIPIDAIIVEMPRAYTLLTFQNDLFFSGHTAVAFLGYLIYRKEKLGNFFLISTVILALTVLLMHLHYSIDVFAAIFITYGSYKLGNWLFGKVIKN